MRVKLAPIALFVYNRLEHTKRTIEALKGNVGASNSSLYIFSDGPSSFKLGDDEAVAAVREYLRTIEGFKEAEVVERRENYGLARSITEGVSQVIQQHKKVVVLEDDMVTSPYFLKFMNEGLSYYESEERVCSIHGYIYPVLRPLPQTFFLRGADCWGWATWKRAWKDYEPNGQLLYDELVKQNLQNEFNYRDGYDFLGMLEKQIKGENNSWAIRWHASMFLKNKLTLYPGTSLVCNIGNDGSGTHCSSNDTYIVGLAQQPIPVETSVEVSGDAYEAFEEFFKQGQPQESTVGYIRRLKQILRLEP